MQKKFLSVILLFTFLMTGCGIVNPKPTPTADQMDKSPFTGIPCAAPCWYGLTVGKSNESEVVSTLGTLTFIDQDTMYFHRMSMSNIDLSTHAPGVQITSNCMRPAKKCLTVDVVDNVLTEISVEFNYEIKVDEAIKYLGAPDYVGYQNLGAERIICGVYLIWNEEQLVLFSQFEGIKEVEKNCYIVRDIGKVSSNLKISEARYLSISAIDYLLSGGASEFFEYTGTLSN